MKANLIEIKEITNPYLTVVHFNTHLSVTNQTSRSPLTSKKKKSVRLQKTSETTRQVKLINIYITLHPTTGCVFFYTSNIHQDR